MEQLRHARFTGLPDDLGPVIKAHGHASVVGRAVVVGHHLDQRHQAQDVRVLAVVQRDAVFEFAVHQHRRRGEGHARQGLRYAVVRPAVGRAGVLGKVAPDADGDLADLGRCVAFGLDQPGCHHGRHVVPQRGPGFCGHAEDGINAWRFFPGRGDFVQARQRTQQAFRALQAFRRASHAFTRQLCGQQAAACRMRVLDAPLVRAAAHRLQHAAGDARRHADGAAGAVCVLAQDRAGACRRRHRAQRRAAADAAADHAAGHLVPRAQPFDGVVADGDCSQHAGQRRVDAFPERKGDRDDQRAGMGP